MIKTTTLYSSSRAGKLSVRRLTALAALTFFLGACSPGKTEGPVAPVKGAATPLPVKVAQVLRKDIPVEVRAVGSAEAFASVEIRSQVTGIIERVGFKEGDPVNVGALLFAIDSRPFLSRLEELKATLAKDRAALDNARKQAERYLPAAEKGYVSAEQSDQAQTNAAALEALVKADEAAIAGARLDLDNCTIRSPLAGYSGELFADPGNLVKAVADQPLVTIHQTSPIKVSFTLPEKTLPELRKHLSSGEVEVVAETSNGPLSGNLSFLDNQVNQTSGTIRLKANFANTARELWPGQFVNIRLRLTTRKGAIVIPGRAVQASQNGDFVYVVGTDKTVEQRPVLVEFSSGEESVITSGLSDGETIVTDGQLRLRAGSTVKTVDEPAGNAAPKAAQ